MNNTSRINTQSLQTINGSLSVGQRLINGSNRVFLIEALSPTEIQLVYSDAIETRRSILSRETFSKLVYMRNYMQVLTKNPLSEVIEATRIGGTRLMIKPAKFQFQ
jgi:hypothetical protein